MEIEISEDDIGKYWNKRSNPNYYHREDGPAVIWDIGDEEWYYYNKLYYCPEVMPLNLFIAYCKWEYKKNGK